jgi:aspartate--ammonia ligase
MGAELLDEGKRADLAGPGIGTYEEVDRVLPDDYSSLLSPRDTQRAIFAVKRYIEDRLCEALHLEMVQVPLIVDAGSGVNDMLDRDGSRSPVQFHISNDHDLHPVDAQVVQAATKWKRVALRQFGMERGEGLCTDMRAVRKDYFLDHDHSAYVDQWDWEQAIAPGDRTLEYLERTVRAIWGVLRGAEAYALDLFPQLRDDRFPNLPEEITFLHAEDILDRYPDLPRKQRETRILQEFPAVFIIGIGWTLDDGYPHEMRAADYDDWSTETVSRDGRPMHGLNGDILVWNHVTRRRHELSSMGIRVDGASLRRQLSMTGQLDWLRLPYHRGIADGTLPLSIGGGIGQSRTQMLLLRKAHLGEVSVTVWPDELKRISDRHNIHVIE